MIEIGFLYRNPTYFKEGVKKKIGYNSANPEA